MHENCRRKHNGNASSSQEAAAMSKMNETPFLDPILLVSKKRTILVLGRFFALNRKYAKGTLSISIL